MRNMWQIVVAVVLAAGAGIALYNFVGDDDASVSGSSASPPGETLVPAKPAGNSEGSPSAQANTPAPDADVGEIPVTEDDHVIGNADAPVTIVEYASLTCPHCAAFHNQVLPGLKKDLIETGKVRLVYRDFPLDGLALAGSMLARCAGPDRYFAFIDILFKDQQHWARSQAPVLDLGRFARLGGLSSSEFVVCHGDPSKRPKPCDPAKTYDHVVCPKDPDLESKILRQRLEASQKYQVNSTPTLIINGKKYSGGMPLDTIKAIVAKISPKS